eukprot:552772_1
MILHDNNGKPAKFDEIITYNANCMLVHMIWVVFVLICVLLAQQNLFFYDESYNYYQTHATYRMQDLNGYWQIKNRKLVHIELYDVLLIQFIPNITSTVIIFIIFKQIFRVANIVSYPCTCKKTSCNNTMVIQNLADKNQCKKQNIHLQERSSSLTAVQQRILGFHRSMSFSRLTIVTLLHFTKYTNNITFTYKPHGHYCIFFMLENIYIHKIYIIKSF